MRTAYITFVTMAGLLVAVPAMAQQQVQQFTVPAGSQASITAQTVVIQPPQIPPSGCISRNEVYSHGDRICSQTADPLYCKNGAWEPVAISAGFTNPCIRR